MLERVLEPEVMSTADEALEYDAIDHDGVNQAFVDDYLKLEPRGQDVLDLGTGNAAIPVCLCQADRSVRVMASDASPAMLDMARYRIEMAGLRDRIQLHCGDAKQLNFSDAYFDSVLSNSLIHHLAAPESVLDEAWRVLRPGGWLFVRDLVRPESAERVEALVAEHAGNEAPAAQQLLRQSLYAALSLSEIRALVSRLDVSSECVQITSDRHWTLAVRKPIA